MSYLQKRAFRRVKHVHTTIRDRSIQNPNQKIRIGFVVCDPAKWSAGPLFESLSSSPNFDCGFYIIPSDVDIRLHHNERCQNYLRTRGFFKSIGEIWGDLYDINKDVYLPASTISGEVIFFQQPWAMQELPRIVSKSSLCCYINYAYSIVQFEKGQYAIPNFHRYLWRLYAQNHYDGDIIRKCIDKSSALKEAIFVAGYPKFDRYMSPPPPRQSVTAWPRHHLTTKHRVIFAPHHAIGEKSLNTSTFAWSANALEQLAIQYKDIDFVLKPHPNLEYAVLNSELMDKKQFEEWMKGWHDRKNCSVFDSGEYFDLFRTSDLMITDSVSFLAEYLPTQSPIIRLSNQGACPLNLIGQKLENAFYKADNTNKLKDLFYDLVIRKNDPSKELRITKKQIIIPFSKSASSIILEDLERII